MNLPAKLQTSLQEAEGMDKKCRDLGCPDEFRLHAVSQAWENLARACLEYIQAQAPLKEADARAKAQANTRTLAEFIDSPDQHEPVPPAATDFMQLIGKPWWWVIHTSLNVASERPRAHLLREGERYAVCGFLVGDQPYRLVHGFKGSGDEYCPLCEKTLPSIQNRG